MTITITKWKVALTITALALLAPSTALASHVFDDVPDAKFYAAAAEWAKINDITTGSPAGSSTFKPDDPVTRGESVTFLKRYNDNIVEVADAALQDDIDANTVAINASTVGLFASDSDFVSTTASGDLGLSATVTIPAGHTGVIEVTFTAESACYNGPSAGWCKVTLLQDGTGLTPDDQAFDSSDDATETSHSWESHAITRVTGDLPAGTYTITAAGDPVTIGVTAPTFRLDDMVLTAQVHLTS